MKSGKTHQYHIHVHGGGPLQPPPGAKARGFLNAPALPFSPEDGSTNRSGPSKGALSWRQLS